MPHAALHLAEEFIADDLDYYFSGERDKNNQIRPDDNIYSMTPNAEYLSHELDDDQIGNFFYPLQPNLLDRIYIGTSVPLFANNWGASFLLQLLNVLKPYGTIILPVYPEGQAQEKGYWSRSFLEDVFLSRQHWTGFSNVRAENDGVMSLQIGRKWPDPIPSTIEWFYHQRSALVLQELQKSDTCNNIQTIYSSLVDKVWTNYSHSAVVEKIILDYYGKKTPLRVHNISNDYGLLLTELLLSSLINVVNGVTTDLSRTEESTKTSENVASNFNNYFSPQTDKLHQIESTDVSGIKFQHESNVMILMNVLSYLDKKTGESLLNRAWHKLKPGGLLIIYEDLTDNDDAIEQNDFCSQLCELGEVQMYSTIVASKIQQDINVSHYSSIQEKKLLQEKRDLKKVFRVVQKI